MAIKVGDYSLVGKYSFHGREGGLQRGEVSLYNDGKIIGRIRDVNPGETRPRCDKLFLGLMYQGYMCLDFLKIAPSYQQGTDLMPIIWTTSRINENAPFSGIWLTAEGLPVIDAFERSMKKTGEFPDLELLANIPVQEMQSMWSFGQIDPEIKRMANDAQQTGQIILTRK